MVWAVTGLSTTGMAQLKMVDSILPGDKVQIAFANNDPHIWDIEHIIQ